MNSCSYNDNTNRADSMSNLDTTELSKIDSQIPEDEILYDLADLFKIFGDTTRIKILYALREAELCVGDLAELLKMNQSAVSHQLKILKQSKLVKFRREGKTIWYSN